MKLSALLISVSLVLTSCVHTDENIQSDCVSYDVFGPYDHSCPQDKHGPCPFCTTEQHDIISKVDL